MPQMSPLMWNYLFILFSFMVVASMIKIYFMTNKMINKQSMETEKMFMNNYKWTW